MTKPKVLEVPVWYTVDGMMYRRDCLPISHPEHTYNYIKRLGYIPESYGVFHPIMEKYKSYSKKQLMSKIVDLELELESVQQYL